MVVLWNKSDIGGNIPTRSGSTITGLIRSKLSKTFYGIMQEKMGEILKISRVRKKLTLQSLSKKCGLSKSFISQIERGEAKPSLASLTKIAHSLDVSLWSLLPENPGSALGEPHEASLPYIYLSPSVTGGYVSKSQLVKKDRRKSLILSNSNIKYSMVTPDLNRKMQILHMTAEPCQDSGRDWFIHEGEECCFMLQGKIEIQVGKEVFYLEGGDSLYFPGGVYHRWKNIGDGPLELIWVMTPPSF